MKKIAILGCGNLGSSIIEGLLLSKFSDPQHLIATRRNTDNLKRYAAQGVTITNDNIIAAREANIIILAVKPFQALEVLKHIKAELEGKILISVVTGVLIKDIKEILNENCSILA